MSEHVGVSERAGRAAGERGGIITGFLIRSLLILALFGLGLFETGAVIFSKVQADGAAAECAGKAAAEFARTGSTAKASAVAEEVAQRRGATLVSLEVADESVTATVTYEAKTLVIHQIGPLQRHSVATATQTVRIV